MKKLEQDRRDLLRSISELDPVCIYCRHEEQTYLFQNGVIKIISCEKQRTEGEFDGIYGEHINVVPAERYFRAYKEQKYTSTTLL